MRATVVIRARDEASSIGRVLELLSAQTVPAQVVVVDSGSHDATREIVRGHGVTLVEMERRDFSFGGALNLGCERAEAPVIVALSAHAFPPGREWLELMLAPFGDPEVACVYGERLDERFRPLRGPVRQDAAMLRHNPFWGYSNSAGGFRADLWRRRPFREDMPGTEDREWSRWALDAGYVCVLDPALAVEHDHSRDGLAASFRRYRREHRGFAMFLDLPPYRAREAVGEWWGDQGGHRSHLRARLDPRRAARLAGKWRGRADAGP